MSTRNAGAAGARDLRRRLLALLGWQALGGALPAARAADESVPAPAWIARQRITSDGVRLNLIEQAPAAAAPGAPTIVLLPGWCMPATIWRAQLGGLGARWTTVAMDPRGQGESAIPAGGYTADRRADDLHEVLQGYERVVLVAWSLGVLEALQYVQRHGSDRLLGLALVDNSIGEPPAPKGSDFLARLRRERRATVDRFVRSLFAHPPPAPELDALRESALRMPLESSIALLSYPLPREHWRDIVHAFDRPLAYLVTPRYREQARHLLEARPASRVEIFENAGHALFVDEAERFNAYLAGWVESLA
jgi:microsomal epoxide hydrolase